MNKERECQVDIVDGDNAAEIAERRERERERSKESEQRGLMMTLL